MVHGVPTLGVMGTTWGRRGLMLAMSLFFAASTPFFAGLFIGGSSHDRRESPRPRGEAVPLASTLSTTAWGGTCLLAPVDGPIVRFFEAPGCPYCAGHRTIDFAVATGEEVRSPVAGRVSFAGLVAGVGYLTVVPTGAPAHLVTVGGVVPAEKLITIAAGDVIGTAQGPETVRLSVRRTQISGQKIYLDPEPYLARWRVRARLIDADRDHARPRRPGHAEFACRPPIAMAVESASDARSR